MPRTAHTEEYVDPLNLDVEPFDCGIIPFNRPVLGADLEMLRMHLGLKVHDMIWLTGMSTAGWYDNTSDPVEKLYNKSERARGRIQEKILNEESLISSLKEEIKDASGKQKESLEKKLASSEGNLLSFKEKLKQAAPTPAAVKKAEKERDENEYGPQKPVRGSVALLARFFDAYNEYVDTVRLRSPTLEDFKEKFPYVEDREIGEMLGRDSSAAYRWFRFQAEPHPTAKRLLDVLMRWLEDEPYNERHVDNLEIWMNCVRREWALRGWELGKVRNPSEDTSASRRPMARSGAA